MQTLTSASSVSRSDSCTTDSRSSSLVIFDVKWIKFLAPQSSRPVLLWQSNTSTYLATTVVSNFSDNKPPSQSSPLNNPQSTLPFCEMFCLCFARSPLSRPAHQPVSSPGYSPARKSPGKPLQTKHPLARRVLPAFWALDLCTCVILGKGTAGKSETSIFEVSFVSCL